MVVKHKTMISCYLDKDNFEIFKKICSLKEEVQSRVVAQLISKFIEKESKILDRKKEKKNV